MSKRPVIGMKIKSIVITYAINDDDVISILNFDNIKRPSKSSVTISFPIQEQNETESPQQDLTLLNVAKIHLREVSKKIMHIINLS